MTADEIKNKLQAKFPEEDIQWKISATTQDKTKGLVVPYLSARIIQNRLDEVLGIDGWKTSYREIEGGFICSLSLKLNDEWIEKQNGADYTEYEKIKGGISSAFKRAASNCFGIGRYIYDMPSQWVKIKKAGKNYIIDEKIELPAIFKIKDSNNIHKYLEMKMTVGKYENYSLNEILQENPSYINHILSKSKLVSNEIIEACKILKKEYRIA